MADPPNDKDTESLERTKAIMAEMLRMPPKPHSEMKIGKRKRKAKPKPKSDRA